ncbi:SMI1/KNR4 family protein [Polycladomyces sp. WAk]|uniref:SMI1/KNR4 family protein n=1 Tax=Polycladomyces zharkentensis TaxID=2807616 RepID=A0ABS2WKP9_9BACL|nr:SMI1/KNR4 family protein [Polycladomyces sp. WAk]MBN2910077.1 SMI1/KNR4 family protein [Polycladomyces sp. WAk]
MGADQTIQTLWAELQKLLNKKVEGYTKLQNEPATIEEIRQIEEKMNLTLPSDLKELYLCNNGEKDGGISILGLPFLPLNEMYRQWKLWDDLREEWNENEGHTSYPDGYIKKMYMNRGWIPFSHDWGGNHIGMDLDPDIKGTYGQIINFGRDENDKFVIAPSLRDFLQLLIEIYRKPEFSIVKDEYEEDCLILYLGDEEISHAIDFLKENIIPD